MTINLKKRTFIRIISFTLAVIFSLVGCIIKNKRTIKHFTTEINNGYSKNLSELNSNLDNITKSLEKIIYTNTASQFSALSNDILAESLAAKNSLLSLPNSTGDELKTINKFLSQVGDYTSYLSKKIIENNEISQDDRDNLSKLLKTGQTINQSLNEISLNYENIDSWHKEISAKIDSVDIDNSFSTELTEIEESLNDYPTLIYDGPFSDHILTAEPKMTKNEKEITREQAMKKVATVFNIDEDLIKNGSDENSQLPAYGFYTEDTTVSVTKRGGHIVFFRKYRKISEQKVSEEETVKIASEFLKNNSNETFTESYYFTDEGVCTVNFAYKNGATVCYTDLIKVGVAIDTGEIVFLEARGYLMNHEKRSITTPKYTQDDAKNILAKSLKINSVKQALIPSDGNNEIHCYEFNCDGQNGEKLLIYVNSNTLNEEKIFTVLSTDGGTLVE